MKERVGYRWSGRLKLPAQESAKEDFGLVVRHVKVVGDACKRNELTFIRRAVADMIAGVLNRHVALFDVNHKFTLRPPSLLCKLFLPSVVTPMPL
jgi:hypothetical protein